MKTISEILADVVANMTIVELQDSLKACINEHPGWAKVMQREINRRVARNEHNHERLAAALAR